MTSRTVRAEFFEIVTPAWEAEACALVAEAWERGERVYVWTASEADAMRWDELLWTFRDDAFVPHSVWRGEEGFDEPVAVGWKAANPNGAGRLVVAGGQAGEAVLGAAADFAHLTDFVPKRDRSATEAARERFRALQQAGFAPVFHPAVR